MNHRTRKPWEQVRRRLSIMRLEERRMFDASGLDCPTDFSAINDSDVLVGELAKRSEWVPFDTNAPKANEKLVHEKLVAEQKSPSMADVLGLLFALRATNVRRHPTPAMVDHLFGMIGEGEASSIGVESQLHATLTPPSIIVGVRGPSGPEAIVSLPRTPSLRPVVFIVNPIAVASQNTISEADRSRPSITPASVTSASQGELTTNNIAIAAPSAAANNVSRTDRFSAPLVTSQLGVMGSVYTERVSEMAKTTLPDLNKPVDISGLTTSNTKSLDWANRSQSNAGRNDASPIGLGDGLSSKRAISSEDLKSQTMLNRNPGKLGGADSRIDSRNASRALGESLNADTGFSIVEMIWPTASDLADGKPANVWVDDHTSDSGWASYPGTVYGLWVIAGVSIAVAVFEGIVQSRKRHAQRSDVNELLLIGVHPELATFRCDGNPHVRILD